MPGDGLPQGREGEKFIGGADFDRRGQRWPLRIAARLAMRQDGADVDGQRGDGLFAASADQSGEFPKAFRAVEINCLSRRGRAIFAIHDELRIAVSRRQPHRQFDARQGVTGFIVNGDRTHERKPAGDERGIDPVQEFHLQPDSRSGLAQGFIYRAGQRFLLGTRLHFAGVDCIPAAWRIKVEITPLFPAVPYVTRLGLH